MIGYSTHQGLTQLKKEFQKIHPHFTVVSFGSNNAYFSSMTNENRKRINQNPFVRLRYALNHLRTFQPIRGIIASLWFSLGAFIGIFLVAFITYRIGVPMMVGSFGASVVLLYAAYQVPLAQHRNLIGGHVVSGLVAVSVFQLLGKSDLTVAPAVSTAIAAMLATKILHLPGGVTALMAVDTVQSF